MSVDELEVLRKKARNIEIVCFGIALVIAIVSVIYMKSPASFFMPLILGVVVSGLVTIKPLREFNLAFKNTFVKKSLEEVFTNLVYEPENGISQDIINSTGMMNMGDRYSSNDYISGKYKNINVEQGDVHIQEEHTDSEGDTSYVTIFKGRWMVFDFNKYFKANVQVCSKRFTNSRRALFKYTRVKMEDQDFNNKFRIYAENEHDAFYILTPSLMEKIKNLTSNIQGRVLLCFVNNKLHVGIQNNKDSFEHSIFTKIDEEKVLNIISSDIKLITNFVDELDLDNTLFRREV